jgi:hypothetical protein
MAITKLNSLAIPDNTNVEADLSYPLTNFSLSGDIAHKDAANNARLLYDKSENLLGNQGTNGSFYSIYLGGTAAANQLDDYEEGTWTPTITGSSSGSQSWYGTYTKIGRLVTCHFFIEGTSSTHYSGNLTMSGLPFGVANSSAPSGDWYFGNVTAYQVNTSGGEIYLFSSGSNGTSLEFSIAPNSGAANSLLQGSNLASASVYIRGTITYSTT